MTKSRDVASRGGLTVLSPSTVSVGSGTATVGAYGRIDLNSVTSITLNGVFDTRFKDYKLMYTGSATVIEYLQLQLTASGSVQGGSTYNWTRFISNSTNVIVTPNGADTSWKIGSLFTGQNRFDADLTIPTGNNTYKAYRSSYMASYVNSAPTELGSNGGNIGTSISVDGIRVLVATGQLNGQLTIYGYNNG